MSECLYFVRYWAICVAFVACVAIISFPVCYVINFEIYPYLAFLSSRRPKQSEQKFRCLQNEKSFLGEIKSIFCYR